jgi:HSP20 family protein
MTMLSKRRIGDYFPFPATDWDREMKQLFNGGFGELAPWAGERFVPAIDVRETDDSYIVEADIPGMKKEDIQIEVADNIVTIHGERKSESEEKNKEYHRIERSYGSFRRSVQVPGGFKHDNVSAKFENGVLRVTLPKPEESKPKRVTVTAE